MAIIWDHDMRCPDLSYNVGEYSRTTPFRRLLWALSPIEAKERCWPSLYPSAGIIKCSVTYGTESLHTHIYIDLLQLAMIHVGEVKVQFGVLLCQILAWSWGYLMNGILSIIVAQWDYLNSYSDKVTIVTLAPAFSLFARVSLIYAAI